MSNHGKDLNELLAQLETLWRAQGAPIADRLAVGLTDAEFDRYEETSGLTLPMELRQWWGWHNGVNRIIPNTRWGPESRLGVGPWEFLSLPEALAGRERMLRVAPEEDDDVFWRPSWLPIVDFNGNLLFAECAAERVQHAAVRMWSREPEDFHTPRADSWTTVTRLRVDALANGYFAWSAEDDGWVEQRRDLPAELSALL